MQLLKYIKNPLKKYYTLFLLIFLVTIDQLTKYLSTIYIQLDSILFSFMGFGLTYKINKGLVFSIGEQYDFTVIFSIVIMILILPLILLGYKFYTFKYRKSRWIYFSLLFIVSACCGNLLDQIFLGYVRDFIIWPGPGTPNIADVFSIISVIFLFVEFKKNPSINFPSLFKIRSLKKEMQDAREFISFCKGEIKIYILIVQKRLSFFKQGHFNDKDKKFNKKIS